ncbi:MAG TPA: hypothetical protein VFM05_11600, partial [Candidatus Saccharimonadales bacterium]|nr:hypothetical protein [Candidatus Saccharimonadales bacterium]
MGQNTIIELNGKRYDAITGALLGESRIKATPTSRSKHHGRAIDGVFRGKHTSIVAPTIVQPTPIAPAARPAPAKKTMDIRRMSQHVKAHQPEKAKTLMRHVVAKPKIERKPSIKMAVPSELMAKPASDLAKPLEKKVSVTQVNPVRLARSRQISRSQHIRRYTRDSHAVRSLPLAAAAPQATVANTPKLARNQAMPLTAQIHSNKQKAADIFEEALAHATSHQEPLQPKQGRRAANRRRLVSFSAGIAAFLVIGGFIAYLNMPRIELQVASIRAGFHAEMPGYRPNGYALEGGVKSRDGLVEMTFRSGASSYKVTQEASDWNSATLLDQNTEHRGAPEQTIQSKGRIIY